jgi:hypothetical protein
VIDIIVDKLKAKSKQTINELIEVKNLGGVDDGQGLVYVCSFLDL